MAKIVLCWNWHVNESPVTGSLAKLLKPLLESRGHEVVIKKVPFRDSFHGMHKEDSMISLSTEGTSGKHEQFFNKIERENPDSIILDLHTTALKNMLIALKQADEGFFRKVSRWKARTLDSRPQLFDTIPPILIFPSGTGARCLTVEIPFEHRAISKPLRSLGKKTIKSSKKSGETSIVNRYFTDQADLKKTKAANFLSPTVVRKLAHLIDDTVNTEAGVYRRPRGPKYQKKGSKRRNAKQHRR